MMKYAILYIIIGESLCFWNLTTDGVKMTKTDQSDVGVFAIILFILFWPAFLVHAYRVWRRSV